MDISLFCNAMCFNTLFIAIFDHACFLIISGPFFQDYSVLGLFSKTPNNGDQNRTGTFSENSSMYESLEVINTIFLRPINAR